VRWLLAPATFTTLLLAIPSRGAGHVWLQNRPFDLPMTALVVAVALAPAGLYLGWRKAHAVAGLIGGVVIGVLAAAAIFLVAPVAGVQAVWVAWLLGWLLISVLQSFLDGHLELWRALVRGAAAAAAGAIGFVIVQRQLVVAGLPANLPVFSNFLAWMLAYAPGAALLMRR
jgi:hypothetical protein